MAAPRKDNVKELILEATETLLQDKKISDISLAEIARTAGVSKGTLFYHYKSKNDLMIGLTDKYLHLQYHDLISWTEDTSKDTSLHRLIKYVLERDVSTVNMRLHFFYDAMLGNEEIRKMLLARYREFATLIAGKIAERTEKIDAEYLAWMILLLSDGLFIHKMLHNEDINIDSFIQQTADFGKLL